MSEALTAADTTATTTQSEGVLTDTLLTAEPPAAPAAGAEAGTEPAKPETSEPAKDAEPFTFEKVTLPEGIEVPDEAKTAFTEIVNEHKLPADAAQKFMDLYAQHTKASADAAVAAWKSTNEQWQSEVKADPEIGGANYEKTLQTIGKVLNDPTLTDPGMKAALNLTGAGNNPAVIKTLAKWAAALIEGTHVGGGSTAASKAPRDFGEALYGRQE